MTTPESLGGGSQESPPAPVSTTTDLPTASATQLPPLKKASGLALAALLVGIGAFLFGLVPVFGALVGVVAVVLAILALRKQQSKGMATAGIILGAVAIVASIGMAVGIGAAVNSATEDKAPVQVTAPEAEPAAPVEEAAPAEPEAPAIPVDFASALIKAESYSGVMHMSKTGVFDQLTSEYGEKFTPEAAQYAVDNIQADWNANALAKAKTYQEGMAMSPEAIRDQLTSAYGEKFTPEEADFAILHLND
jgi:hypothetical protein